MLKQDTKLICPNCKHPAPRVDYPDIWCPNCGYSDCLFDYPVSWNTHRAMCLDHGKPDPGACDVPPEPEIEQRVTVLENVVTPPEKWEGKQWDMVKQMRSEISYLRNKLNEHLDYRRKRREAMY
jgi:uncharacterized Zn finger protein (UPF0148 family)